MRTRTRALEPTSREESRDIYQLFVERAREPRRSVASNRDTADLLAVFNDTLLAQSAVDRFKDNAFDLVIDGESYRASVLRSIAATPAGECGEGTSGCEAAAVYGLPAIREQLGDAVAGLILDAEEHVGEVRLGVRPTTRLGMRAPSFTWLPRSKENGPPRETIFSTAC